MDNDVPSRGWQRLVDWLKRQWGDFGDRVPARERTATDRAAAPAPERVAAWENEGGATAAKPATGDSALPPTNERDQSKPSA